MKKENRKIKDRLMIADDIFVEGLKQVFSVRTGEFLGYTGEKHLEEPEPEEQTEVISQNQLSIF